VRTQPISIDGVDGQVVVATNWKGGVGVYVGGREVEKVGQDRFQLPAVKGADLEGHLVMKVWQVFPTLVVNSVEHRTGPKTPIALIGLAGLPLLLVIVSWYGIVFGLTTALLNQSALRESTNIFVRIGRITVQNLLGIGLFLVLHGS
jgi:hypothetical protein